MRGFTLIEVQIAMALMLLGMGAMHSEFTEMSRQLTWLDNQNAILLWASQDASKIMVSRIHSAAKSAPAPEQLNLEGVSLDSDTAVAILALTEPEHESSDPP